jgi:hypothetical protein
MTSTRRNRRQAASGRALWSASSVLAYRFPLLWKMAADPTPARRREARRMVTEKAAAAFEGALAMQRELLTQARSLWLLAWHGAVTPTRLARAGASIADAGAAPALRRLHANARRLRRRKRT